MPPRSHVRCLLLPVYTTSHPPRQQGTVASTFLHLDAPDHRSEIPLAAAALARCLLQDQYRTIEFERKVLLAPAWRHNAIKERERHRDRAEQKEYGDACGSFLSAYLHTTDFLSESAISCVANHMTREQDTAQLSLHTSHEYPSHHERHTIQPSRQQRKGRNCRRGEGDMGVGKATVADACINSS